VAVIAFTSFSGSPGVSTAALAFAVHWPRPVVLFEADTANVTSAMPGFFRSNLPPTIAGLDKVAVAYARDILTWQDLLDPDTKLSIAVHDLPTVGQMPIPALPTGHRLWVVPGFFHLTIVDGVRGLWGRLPRLFRALSDAGIDVVVDLGRTNPNDIRLPILDQADRVLVCASATMVDLNRVYRRLELPDLADRLQGIGRAEKYRLLLGEAPAEAVAPSDFAAHLMPVLATLPFDPDGAATFSLGKLDPRPNRNIYRQGIRRAVTVLGDETRPTEQKTDDSLERKAG
jgi:hypothetical protein